MRSRCSNAASLFNSLSLSLSHKHIENTLLLNVWRVTEKHQIGRTDFHTLKWIHKNTKSAHTHTHSASHTMAYPFRFIQGGGSFTAQTCGSRFSNLDEWLRSYIISLMSDYFNTGGSQHMRVMRVKNTPHLGIWAKLLVWVAELITDKNWYGLFCS